MLPFGMSFLAWLGSTAVPALVGLILITSLGKRVKARYLAAFALGIFFWFFVDTIGGSANLDVNAGFTGGINQVAIVALFAIGILLFCSLDKGVFAPDSGKVDGGVTISLLAAVALGIHGFGEGTAFGSTAALTSNTSLFDAFGGASAGISYVLHKALEPMMVGALYVAYLSDRPEKMTRRMRNILLLTLLFVLPSAVGAATGYFINYDATYFFALGTGTSIYAGLRLARPLFQTQGTAGSNESVKISIALIAGFILIYLAALFHS